jgi:hypothetical protein
MKKRIMSLLLALVMCLCVFLSCDDNESTQSESSSEQTQDKFAPTQTSGFPYIDENGFPVLKNASFTYKHINLQAKEDLPYNTYDTKVIYNYETLRTFMLQNLTQSSINGIDDTFFEEYILLAVYRDNGRKMKEYYSYSALSPLAFNHGNHMTVDMEYLLYPDKAYTMEIGPNTFDFVVIPLSHISAKNNAQNLVISVKHRQHIYSKNTYVSSENLLDYSVGSNPLSVEVINVQNVRLSSIKNQYEFYSFYTKGNATVPTTVFADYESFSSFAQNNLTDEEINTAFSKITESTFNDYYVFPSTLSQGADMYSSFGDIRQNGEHYIIDLECMNYPYIDSPAVEMIDFVLIPKGEIANPNATVYIRKTTHSYELKTQDAPNPF